MKFTALIKRLVVVIFLLSTFYLLFSVSPVSAQYQNPSQNLNTNPNVPQNFHTYVQAVTIEVMSSMTCILAGVDISSPNQKCLGYDSKTGKIGYTQGNGGAIGAMGGMIAMLYQSPLHTSDYLAYLSRNFGIAKPTYAQGVVLEGLQPLVKLWTYFRNLVYLLFVLVFVIIGLAIMLRVKIDPRTVMSIENQLPKIIIGLLLVTFSLAIAGFLIDFMYVLIYFAFNVFSNPAVAGDATTVGKIASVQSNFFKDSPLGVFNNLIGILNIAGAASGGVKDLIMALFMNTNPPEKDSIFIWSGIVNIVSGKWVADVLVNFISWLGMVLAFLIILIAILWALFRLWFTLIMAYVYILLDIVLAPFWILSGLIPGNPIGFGAWLRDISANLIAFPATIIMFLMGKTLMDAFSNPNSKVFVPPLVGNLSGSINALGPLIGLGFILMTPNIVNMAKAALKAPKIDISAIGQAISAGGGTAGGTLKQTASSVYASKAGTYPQPGEKGFSAVMRNFMGKLR